MHFTEKSQYMINKFGAEGGNPTVKVDGNENEGNKKVEWIWANKVISPWHDIPYKCSAGLVSFVCEIPKFERAKMECATKLPHNPIIQDKNKDGTPRFYHGPIFWNYGYVPQTWENPETEDKELGYKGDADPLDVVEIGMVKRQVGSVTPVKPLGILAMIDSGEVDWKMICIAEDDPLFDELDNIEDLERKCPGTISGIREWFRWYKTPDMKEKNIFGFKEEVLGVKKCWEVINHVHQDWKDLMMGKAGNGQFWTGVEEGDALNLSVSH
jgi:inorganic pyrophosphatase